MMSLDINKQVTVRLTPHGKTLYKYYISDLDIAEAVIGRELKYIDENDTFEFEPWELELIFGIEMYENNPNPCFVDK